VHAFALPDAMGLVLWMERASAAVATTSYYLVRPLPRATEPPKKAQQSKHTIAVADLFWDGNSWYLLRRPYPVVKSTTQTLQFACGFDYACQVRGRRRRCHGTRSFRETTSHNCWPRNHQGGSLECADGRIVRLWRACGQCCNAFLHFQNKMPVADVNLQVGFSDLLDIVEPPGFIAFRIESQAVALSAKHGEIAGTLHEPGG